jgi:acetoacetate decarboxylase
MRNSAIPASSPSYLRGPYRIVDHEHLNVVYESEPDTIPKIIQ